jgi:hypothetical protein
MLDLPGIIEGAKDGKGRGRQVSPSTRIGALAGAACKNREGFPGARPMHGWCCDFPVMGAALLASPCVEDSAAAVAFAQHAVAFRGQPRHASSASQHPPLCLSDDLPSLMRLTLPGHQHCAHLQPDPHCAGLPQAPHAQEGGWWEKGEGRSAIRGVRSARVE